MSKLGIKKDLQAKAGIPIPAPKKLDKHTALFPNGWEFPVANLVNVTFDAEKSISRNGVEEKVPALTFVYKAKDGKQFTQVEFPIDMDDEKFDNKHTALTQRIKHIFEEVLGESKFEEIEADTYAELFEKTAAMFNKHVGTKGEGEDAKKFKLYSTTPIYLKLVYYKDRLQVPMYPNIVQRAMGSNGQVPCELMINVTYDKTEPEAKAKANSSYGGGTDNQFGGGDFGDFPAIPQG